MSDMTKGLVGGGDQPPPTNVLSPEHSSPDLAPPPEDHPSSGGDPSPDGDPSPPAGSCPVFPYSPDGEIPADHNVEWEITSGFALVEGISEESKLIGWAEAQRLRNIAALYAVDQMHPLPPPPAAQARAGRRGREVGALTREDLTAHEVAARLCVSDYAARRLVRLALALTSRFPGTLAALSAGRLDLRRAEIIEEHAGPLAEDHYQQALTEHGSPVEAERAAARIAGMVEALVLGKATTQTPDQLHPAVRRVVHRLDPDFADRQVKRDLKGRQVTHRTNPADGTGDVYAHLGAAEALGVYGVVDGYARAARAAGSDRNLNELRADALTQLVLYGHLPEGSTPSRLAPVDTEHATLVPEVDPNTGDIRHTPTDTDISGDAAATSNIETDAATTAAAAVTSTSTETGADTTSSGNESDPATTTADSTGAVDPIGSADSPGSDTATDTATGSATGSATATGAGSAIGTDTTRDPGTTVPARSTTGSQRSGRSGRSATRSGLRAHVNVTVGLETLLGLNQDPADLTGHGPITAQTARDLAFHPDSTWRRLITDPITGYLLNYGRSTYRPPTALAEHVRARDVTCRTPTCHRPATACDLDHVISWPAGETSEPNLACECDRDHRYKHEGNWRHQLSTDPQHPPGTIVMISPTGHIYLSHPHTYTDPPLNPPPKSPPGHRDSHRQPAQAGTSDPPGLGDPPETNDPPGQDASPHAFSVLGSRGPNGLDDDPGPPPF